MIRTFRRKQMSNISTGSGIKIREVATIAEYDACIRLQRDVFGLPDLEISPRRHLIVSHCAGGWTLGAFVDDNLIGFVHHLAAVKDNYIFGYSHMMAVATEYQNQGVGAQLKWAQRERALAEGRDYIKWTFEPMRARNAHFNLNRLGAVVREYAVNFYGTDYATNQAEKGTVGGMDSDRLFASWDLKAPRVASFSRGEETRLGAPGRANEIPGDFSSLLKTDPETAKREVVRVREEFVRALNDGFVCRAFARDEQGPRYLFYPE